MKIFLQKCATPVLIMVIALFVLFSFAGCTISKDKLVILSGSENDTLEPILEEFEKINRVDIEMQYKGSVDIMLELEKGGIDADVVWPANSLWVTLGDKGHIVKHMQSIMTSPVVFGIRKSLAEELGFTGRKVPVRDILDAINNKKLSFMMTSATQSNSGASAYIGFLYALLGNPETITMENLHDPQLKDGIRTLLSGINRSSGSSGWLKDLFLKGDYDAMVNYESMIIETNQELVKQGKEPLYAVYPYDGLVIADSPLCYLNKGDEKKERLFTKLQEYLLSKEVQDKIAGLGRRTGLGGLTADYDQNVFNPDWGIDTQKVLSPIRMPSAGVINEALNLYQTQFKKPSLTYFCLDFSGSMNGEGEKRLKEAMETLLDQESARQYLLQSSSEDVTVVIPFSGNVISSWKVTGNDPTDMEQLTQEINRLQPGGSTDIYSPVIQAMEEIRNSNTDQYITSIVLMTDGESNTGKSFNDLQAVWKESGKDIPVFSILFGSASEKQLNAITELTRARIFDGKEDLIDAFKKVRGYN